MYVYMCYNLSTLRTVTLYNKQLTALFVEFFLLVRAIIFLKKSPTRLNLFNLKNKSKKNHTRRAKKFFKKIIMRLYCLSAMPVAVIALPRYRNLNLNRCRPVFSVRSLFHIKCLFDINEYLMYDFYNFYAAKLQKRCKRFKKTRFEAFTPTKLNFFYYIRRSIRIFRLHTLRFFKVSFNTERKTNLFFKSFWKMSTLAYLWFFEFNLCIFIVKCGFASSLFAAIIAINSGFLALNGCMCNRRWDLVTPGNVIISTHSVYTLISAKVRLLSYMTLLRRFKKFLFRHLIRRRVTFKSNRFFKKSKRLALTKQTNLMYVETDWLTLKATLLPFKNNKVYYSYIFCKWLNYWNYKTVLWKYDT